MIREIYFWKKAPFIRLLFPLMAGILVQWHLQCDLEFWWYILSAGVLSAIGFFYFPLFKKFRYRALNGLTLVLPFTAIGAILVWHHDIRHSNNWIGDQSRGKVSYFVSLAESPVEKTRSLKANAVVLCQIDSGKKFPVNGKIIIYFKKDSMHASLEYGTGLLFKKPLQEIKNPGNPGSFDYKRYALFQGLTHQVYLEPGDYTILPGINKNWLPDFLGNTRKMVLSILRKNIPGEKELGLAEALLIGYKDDLDKSLVQSYSNTGVVHIIAISGLHLGLIYWLLVSILKPLHGKKYGNWLRPVTIIIGLWLFSLLAGAQPSILRSAVMFTCIVLGENLGRRTSIYNTLALSAFLLLCYNPYWLWDLGFQLSYSAVLSIVIFMRPVYNLLYIKNRLLDFLWKMNAVTIAAQILTLPIGIYHFHQFPTLFLFSNFVAVPLSSIILLSEIFLCIISFISPLASLSGKLINWLIGIMNSYIEKMEGISFSVWNGLQINISQVILLFVFMAAVSYWLLEKSRTGLLTGLLALMSFLVIRLHSFHNASQQQKIIVYNVPKHQAIDFVSGRKFVFAGDTELARDDFINNFHLKPSRTLQRIKPGDGAGQLFKSGYFISFGNKNILLADRNLSFMPVKERLSLDLLIISRNQWSTISKLSQTFDVKKVVFDSSIPAWRLKRWKKDCDSLHIPYHDVIEKGAFVMSMN